jgi:hypothetical protein
MKAAQSWDSRANSDAMFATSSLGRVDLPSKDGLFRPLQPFLMHTIVVVRPSARAGHA